MSWDYVTLFVDHHPSWSSLLWGYSSDNLHFHISQIVCFHSYEKSLQNKKIFFVNLSIFHSIVAITEEEIKFYLFSEIFSAFFSLQNKQWNSKCVVETLIVEKIRYTYYTLTSDKARVKQNISIVPHTLPSPTNDILKMFSKLGDKCFTKISSSSQQTQKLLFKYWSE